MISAAPRRGGQPDAGIARAAHTALACLAVMAVAAFLLFFRLGAIRAPIWDEAYYLPSTARVHEGRLQFATHPPLGLLLIAAGDALYGANENVDQHALSAVKAIKAEAVPAGYDYLGPRLASATFGVVAAGLFFLLMAELTGSTGAALMLSPLYLCDTALLAQSRAAHLDPFQICFVLVALLCLARGIAEPRRRWAAGFAAGVTAAALVRANAVVLAPLELVVLWPLARQCRWRPLGGGVLASVGGAAAMLCTVAAVFAMAAPRLPDESTSAGAKDLAYVSPKLVQVGQLDIGDPGSLLLVGADYLRFMVSDNQAMARHDGNASDPWQWLLGMGAITYRWDAGPSRVATIALLPNYAAWLISLVGVFLTVWDGRRKLSRLPAALLAGWALNMAALLWLDRTRVLYLYCYFLPLLFGHAMAALAWRRRGLDERAARLGLAAVTLCFLVAAPLILHHAVPKPYCAALLRECGD